MLRVGDKLGRYTIGSRIGAGAMGEVFRARDERLGRDVALKILSQRLNDTPEAVERFTREAGAASALNHPNVVTIYEIGESDGTTFIAMEYVEGATIRALIPARPLVETLAKLAAQMARALKVTHAKGIMHRDIKPENIIVRPDGIVKVLDFGLAKQGNPVAGLSDPKLAEMTSPGVVIGTARYMSPEQARGDKVGCPSDIFSLGMVLYELASGRHPFASDFPMEVLRAIMSDPPPPLARWRNDVPPKLESLITRMLAKLPQARPTAEEVERGFDEWARSVDAISAPAQKPDSAEVSAEPISAPVNETVRSRPTPTVNGKSVERRSRSRAAEISAAVFILVIAGAAIFHFFTQPSAAGSRLGSIAVLPFANVRGDTNTEYLSDGLTESIIGSLAQLPKLRVLARSTVFRFKGKEVDPRAAGKELGVEAVLTGRVVQEGRGLAISTELVKVGDGSRLWGGEYNRTISDLVAMKQDIAREIAAKLSARLSGMPSQSAGRDTIDNEAYRLYLEGRYFWNKRNRDSLLKSIDLFQMAIERDPNYALAYAGLADGYALLPQYSGVTSAESLAKAEAAARRALQMDESLAEAHATLGLIAETRYAWAEAEREFKRSIEINPEYATARQWYGNTLENLGRWDEAIVQLKKAEELDPLSLIIKFNLAEHYAFTGQTDLAAQKLEQVRELDPVFYSRFAEVGFILIRQHRAADGLAFIEKAVEASGRSSGSLSYLGYAYAVMGQPVRARQVLDELERAYSNGKATADEVGFVWLGLGDLDQTIAWLTKAVEAHDLIPSSLCLEEYSALRKDPRYPPLMSRMGLKPH
jgi:serine/threonine-protein kinase